MLTTPITHHFHCRLSSRGKVPPDLHSLPSDATQFLVWFSDLRAGIVNGFDNAGMMTSSLHADWQQQEVLHLIVLNLDSCELYYLSTLLIVSHITAASYHLSISLILSLVKTI